MLGTYYLRLSILSYLIHGTNDPEGVGEGTAGCLRMYDEDVEFLYNKVSIKTKVTIISEPYLYAYQNNKLYLESHYPWSNLDGIIKYVPPKSLMPKLNQTKLSSNEKDIVFSILDKHLGLPVVINLK